MESLCSAPVRVLELFAGVGGAACAFKGIAPIVAAIDINQQAQRVYELNFDHPYFVKSVEDYSPDQIQQIGANCWWVSAPCQPHTRRGKQLDAADPRSQGLKQIVKWLPETGPEYFLLENVCGFANSEMHNLLLNQLEKQNYQFSEVELCPTQFGIPNRRPRYYLCAVRSSSNAATQRLNGITSLASYRSDQKMQLQPFLERQEQPSDALPSDELKRYEAGMNIVTCQATETNCFTSAYGKSMTKCGSYLRSPTGPNDSDLTVRRFTPDEIARLLGFWGDALDQPFAFPASLNIRQQWKLLGNTISVFVVKQILSKLF